LHCPQSGTTRSPPTPFNPAQFANS
jgi:hypothetical protein